jgi:uncharacterized membrane protein YeaQ/YmgE (transglycosylase-associated protein family)
MRLRTPVSLLLGTVLGGIVGWLAFSYSIVRDDAAEGVGMVLIGAVYGSYIAMLLLTGGTCDFRSNQPSKL